MHQHRCDVVGAVDIAGRLGVKQQTVAQWKLRGLLPPPRWMVSGLPCWCWSDIETWAQATGRLNPEPTRTDRRNR